MPEFPSDPGEMIALDRTPPGAPAHVAQFYESEQFLVDTVAHFLAPALATGDPGLVVATDRHRQAFSRRIEDCGVDVRRAVRDGQLIFLDARDVLARVMSGSWPDEAAFINLIGDALIRSQGRAGRPPRVFGELVDLLWRQRNPRAALRLEELWNELGTVLPFQLLCGYLIDDFADDESAEPFERVCQAHREVYPTEGFSSIDEPDRQRREISRLQRRAQALASEIAQRRALELSLRQALADRQRAHDELRRSHGEIKRLFSLTAALARTRTPEQVAEVVVDAGVAATGAYAGNLFRCSADGRALELLRAIGYPADALTAHVRIALDSELPLAQAVTNLAPLFLDAPEAYAQFPRPPGPVQAQPGALAAVPLVVDGMAIGVLGFSYSTPRPFDERERTFLIALANQCAQALERARLQEVELAARRGSPPPVSPAATAPGLRILVVDDNIDAAEGLAEVLRELGHEVSIAHDGVAALSTAEAFHPTTALVEVGLPVMDGYQVARKLRERFSPAQLRLIAITGYGQDSDRHRSGDVGFDRQLVKPVNLDAVASVLGA